MKQINTSNGVYEYKELQFVNGIKKIDREISKNNLLDVKQLLDFKGVLFGLIYGTLLGAIRENNFIAHDEDTDLFILEENKDNFLATLFELRKLGFEVGRYDGKLISIVRNGEYIDFYFFRKKSTSTRECDGYVMRNNFLENLVDYPFLGSNFNIPKEAEKLLVNLYGKDWKTPKENTPASNYGVYLSIKMFIKNNFNFLFRIISKYKKKIESMKQK
jgi:phosphorylcholine metabolism protein LicD